MAWKLRLQVIQHYGPACACRSEENPHFLQIDHIDGGGNQHKKANNIAGSRMARWLKKHNFPKGFRILCANCNFALGLYGFCPHDGNGKQLDMFPIPRNKIARASRDID
jgi:hypothetical protein